MGSRKEYKWVGGGQNIEPETDAGTTTGEVIQIVPALPLADAGMIPGQCTLEAIYLHFSIHRLLITEIDALGFLVWVANVKETNVEPAQALDALSLAARAYSNKNILMMAPLPVPPILASSDLLSAIVSEEVFTDHHEYQASRKINRSTDVVALTVNCDVSVATNVFVQWRALLSYGKR